MLYREIIAVCSEIHTKHINTLSGQNVELLNMNLVVRVKWVPDTTAWCVFRLQIGGYKYIANSVAKNRQGVVLQFGV
jgi:hypothetical protein